MTDYTSLYKLIETLYSKYNGKSILPDWFSVNLKTLLSKNITIEDWNSLQINVKNVVGESSALYSFCNSLIPVIKELINSTAHSIKFNNTNNTLYLLDANEEIIANAVLQIQYDMELSADSTNAVQNKVIKEALDKKLDKVTDPNSYIRVYGISPAGSQKTIPANEFAHAGHVAMYGPEGQLSSEDPTETYHVANKKYVDKAIENIDLKSDVVDIVHTHADLESYDTSTLTADDIIKVLQDETHDNASSYYRWNTVFEYVGSEGPYYTQTQVDEKLDNKVDKVAKGIYWQVYGIGTERTPLPENDGKTINASNRALPDTLINRNQWGIAQINDPQSDLDITNKRYVDRKMDYIVFNDTIFSKSSTLTQTEYNDLYAFYNKHYNKDKLPLFAIDKNGSIASVSLETNRWINFTLFSDDLSPNILKIQVSTDTYHSRQFSYSSGYLHNILGQDSWKKDVKARIGVNSDNKLIITDESGNQTPGQTPSVFIPPYTKDSNNKWKLTKGTFQTEVPTADKDVPNKSYVDKKFETVEKQVPVYIEIKGDFDPYITDEEAGSGSIPSTDQNYSIIREGIIKALNNKQPLILNVPDIPAVFYLCDISQAPDLTQEERYYDVYLASIDYDGWYGCVEFTFGTSEDGIALTYQTDNFVIQNDFNNLSGKVDTIEPNTPIVISLPLADLEAQASIPPSNQYYNVVKDAFVKQQQTGRPLFIQDTNNHYMYVLSKAAEKINNPTGDAGEYYDYYFSNVNTNDGQTLCYENIYFFVGDDMSFDHSDIQLADATDISNIDNTVSKITKYTGENISESSVSTIKNRYKDNVGQLILDLSSLKNTKDIIDMSNAFMDCKNLVAIPYIELVSCKTMTATFRGCYSLGYVPWLNTQNVTTMENCFLNCHSLITIPFWDTNKVTNMSGMFHGCSALQKIPLLNTSKVTSMSQMFYGCNTLEKIPLFDTKNVTTMLVTFANCYALTEIPALDVSNVTSMNLAFRYCSNLKSILMYGMKVSFDISDSTFSREALVTILNNLATVETTQTLTLRSTNLAQLTDEDKAIATAKGWTLA